jgi:hypothetical protein
LFLTISTRFGEFWKNESLTAPASTAAFTPPAAFTPSAPSTAAAVLARHHRASFVHYNGPAHKIAAVAGFNGMVGGRVIVDFDESKATRLSSKPITHYIHAVHGDTRLRKEIRYVGFSRRIGEVPYK